jgi:hypothetical protein
MPLGNDDDSGSSQSADIKSGFDATREALLSIEVRRTIALLEAKSEEGLPYEEAKNIWLTQQTKSLKSRYAYLFRATLPWWSVFRTPIGTLNFFIERRRLRRDQNASPERFEELDAILGRAEFSFYLSVAARNYMRQQVDSGAISRWEALSLIRSFGCKITRDGGISPNPIGKLGMFFGLAISLVLITLYLVFAAALGSELGKPCVRQCVVVGASQLMLVTGYFAALLLSLSWWRQRAARKVPSISGDQEPTAVAIHGASAS